MKSPPLFFLFVLLHMHLSISNRTHHTYHRESVQVCTLTGAGGGWWGGGCCKCKCDSQKRRSCKKQLVPLNNNEKLRRRDGEACHLTQTHFTNCCRSITHEAGPLFIYLIFLFDPQQRAFESIFFIVLGSPSHL